MTPDQFEDLLSRLPTLQSGIRDQRIASNMLYMYLEKVRTGIPNEDIGEHFGLSKSTVGRHLNTAREALRKDFMNEHINYIPDRNELLGKSTVMCNSLYNLEGNTAVLVADGTYLFINKSQNYKVQRESYTDQKKTQFCENNDGCRTWSVRGWEE